MNDVQSLTPPSKAPKTPKVAKEPKAPKAPKDPNSATPKTRLNAGSTIGIANAERSDKYKGMRRVIFDELKTYEGKTVETYLKGAAEVKSPKGIVQSHASFLAFFVKDGTAVLTAAA